MPIASSDIHYRITGAASGNGATSGGASGSLGFFMSKTDIVNNTLDNLFDDITGDRNALQQIDYRCVFIYNAHATLTYQNVFVWLSGQRFTTTFGSNQFNVTSHGFVLNEIVRVENEYVTDTMPGGFNDTTNYFVISPTTNAFQLSLSANGSVVTMSADGTGAVRQYAITTMAIATDNKGIVAASGGTNPPVPQATGIPSPTGLPTGISAFSAPTTKAGGLSIGYIPAGSGQAIWIRRTATNSVAANNDGVTLQCAGDTAA